MSTSYLIVAAVTIAVNTAAAVADFVRAKFVLANAAELDLPAFSILPLGVLKLAGAAGLALGMAGSKGIGIAAAVGLVLFFVGAVGIHIWKSVYRNIGYPGACLVLAGATLVLSVS